MADISQIQLPNTNIYNIKDAYLHPVNITGKIGSLNDLAAPSAADVNSTLKDLAISESELGSDTIKCYYCGTESGGASITDKPDNYSINPSNNDFYGNFVLIQTRFRRVNNTDYIIKQQFKAKTGEIFTRMYIKSSSSSTWTSWRTQIEDLTKKLNRGDSVDLNNLMQTGSMYEPPILKFTNRVNNSSLSTYILNAPSNLNTTNFILTSKRLRYNNNTNYSILQTYETNGRIFERICDYTGAGNWIRNSWKQKSFMILTEDINNTNKVWGTDSLGVPGWQNLNLFGTLNCEFDIKYSSWSSNSSETNTTLSIQYYILNQNSNSAIYYIPSQKFILYRITPNTDTTDSHFQHFRIFIPFAKDGADLSAVAKPVFYDSTNGYTFGEEKTGTLHYNGNNPIRYYFDFSAGYFNNTSAYAFEITLQGMFPGSYL